MAWRLASGVRGARCDGFSAVVSTYSLGGGDFAEEVLPGIAEIDGG